MRQWRRAAGFGILLVALLSMVSQAAARQVVFVGHAHDGIVSLLDGHSFKRLGTLNVIPDGKTPQDPMQALVYPALVEAKGVNYVQGLAASPDGRTLYVSRGFLGDVAAFEVATGNLLWRRQIGGFRADHIAISPGGQRLFVSALSDNKVQVIDTRTHAFAGEFPTGDWPHVIQFSPDARYVYNGSLGNQLLPEDQEGKRQLTVANAKTLEVVRTMPFDAGVRPFVFTANGKRMYVQLSFFNGFVEIDPLTGKTLRMKKLPLRGPGKHLARDDYPNEAAHHGITISGNGKTICAAGTISNYVALVNRRSLKTRKIIRVGDEPAEAETSHDGRYCLVANRGDNARNLSVISFRRQRVVKRISVAARPQEMTDAKVPDAVLRAGGFLR
jgi:DNA-binding beta-propeller fold protein YncE